MRRVIRKRLMDEPRIEGAGEAAGPDAADAGTTAGFVTLDPPPPPSRGGPRSDTGYGSRRAAPMPATPTPALDKLLVFRSIHPLYGAFLLDHLGIADRDERLQALESVLEMPRPLLQVRPRAAGRTSCRPGRWPATRLDPELIRRGLIAGPGAAADEEDEDDDDDGSRERPPTLAEKLRLLFDATVPGRRPTYTPAGVGGRRAAAHYGGNFNLYVRSTRPDQAGGHHLPPPAAADPAVRRVRPGAPGGDDAGGVAGGPARHRATG